MKTVIEFGVRGGQFAESIILPSQALGAQMASNMVRVFSNNQQHTYADKKQWHVGNGMPRRSWSSSTHFVALSILDGEPRGPASANFGRKTMPPSNIEINPEDISISTYNTGSNWFPNHNGIIITHIPTGIWARCGEERSQHRNKHNAFEMLIKKLQTAKGIEKPHIFIHKGCWRVSRVPRGCPCWLWHKAHWQINQSME